MKYFIFLCFTLACANHISASEQPEDPTRFMTEEQKTEYLAIFNEGYNIRDKASDEYETNLKRLQEFTNTLPAGYARNNLQQFHDDLKNRCLRMSRLLKENLGENKYKERMGLKPENTNE